ncbi:MAG TPA: hypothetical protein VFE45_11525 [Coriobacteriia bacterium]|nr:hypothetical protein [Coriobacteriia bacterium]
MVRVPAKDLTRDDLGKIVTFSQDSNGVVESIRGHITAITHTAPTEANGTAVTTLHVTTLGAIFERRLRLTEAVDLDE